MRCVSRRNAVSGSAALITTRNLPGILLEVGPLRVANYFQEPFPAHAFFFRAETTVSTTSEKNADNI